jgi:hypothetical protein
MRVKKKQLKLQCMPFLGLCKDKIGNFSAVDVFKKNMRITVVFFGRFFSLT